MDLESEVGMTAGGCRRFRFVYGDTEVGDAEVRERELTPLLETMGVESDYRGRGIGSAMLDRIADYYAEDYEELWVHALPGARGFYAVNGFTVADTEPGSYFMRKQL